MKAMKLKYLMMAMWVMTFATGLNAIELRIDEDERVETGRFDDDYLFFGERLQFKGLARDLFFFGEQIDLNGNLALALIAGARTVNVFGDVGNGIKAGAQHINVEGTVTGTSFLAGEEITWNENSRAVGDTFIGARKAHLKGKMAGNLYVGAAEVAIENVIEGNVQIRAGQIKISDQGRIIGDLIYYSDHQLSEAEKARITGNIRFEKKEDGYFRDHLEEKPEHGSLMFKIALKVALAILGFILLLLPATKRLEKQLDLREILSYALWGLIPIFIYPTLIVVAVLLIITIPLAASMLLALVPLVLITKTIGITLLGGYLADMANLNINSRFLFYLIGIVLYSLLSFIPIFGYILLVFVSSIGCGLCLFWLLAKKPARAY